MMINTEKDGTFSILYGKVFRCCMRFADDYTQKAWLEFGKESAEICTQAIGDPCEPIIRRMLIGFAAWRDSATEVNQNRLKEIMINFWHIAVACIQEENEEQVKKDFLEKYSDCEYTAYLIRAIDALKYIRTAA